MGEARLNVATELGSHELADYYGRAARKHLDALQAILLPSIALPE